MSTTPAPAPAMFDMTAVLANAVANSNKNAEAVYQDALNRYNSAVSGWITVETHNRELSKDPTHYTPNPPPTIPTKTVYTLDGTKVNTSQWQDPSIQPPVLPAYVPPSNVNAFATLQPNQNSAELDMTMVALSQIQSDIAKIKAFFGIV